MRNRRAARWGWWCGGLLVVGSLAPAGPADQAPSAAVRESAQLKIRAATEVLTMCREFLVAPPGQRGTPAPIEVAEQIQYWSRAVTDARLEAAENQDERVAILTEAFERAKGYEAEVKDLAGNEASGLTKLSSAKALYYRADVENQLLRAKALADKSPTAR